MSFPADIILRVCIFSPAKYGNPAANQPENTLGSSVLLSLKPARSGKNKQRTSSGIYDGGVKTLLERDSLSHWKARLEDNCNDISASYGHG